MSEDCLYLNIWTPAKSAGERLPARAPHASRSDLLVLLEARGVTLAQVEARLQKISLDAPADLPDGRLQRAEMHGGNRDA